MILSDADIKKLLKEGKLKITPLSEEQIGSASIDLTLSDEWAFFKNEYSLKTVDLSKLSFDQVTETRKADSVVLPSMGMCLAKTIEKITLPADIMGKLEGRSRYARMGLIIHTTSALVQPGSDNRQVLEIVNLAPFSIVLHKGMRISQVVLEKLQSPTSKPYAKFGTIAKNQ